MSHKLFHFFYHSGIAFHLPRKDLRLGFNTESFQESIILDDLSLNSFFLRQPHIPKEWRIESYNEAVTQPYFSLSDFQYKWHLEQGAMCTRKTSQFINYIAEHPQTTYLLIGCRISFCQDIHHRMKKQVPSVPFVLYHSADFQKLRQKPHAQHTNVIIQYESLWQIARFSYHTIIIDEITTVLSCLISPTNKYKLKENAETLLQKLSAAQRIILLDADLNAKTLVFIQEIEKQSKSPLLLRINCYRPPAMQKHFFLFVDFPKKFSFDSFLNVQNPLSTPKDGPSILASLEEKLTPAKEVKPCAKYHFIQILKKKILEKKRIVIVTGSIHFFETEIEPWLQTQHIGYKWYKQDSGNQYDLQDIHQCWHSEVTVKQKGSSKKRKCPSEPSENHIDAEDMAIDDEEKDYQVTLQVVAFTNRITVGLSYELHDFDTIFIYGTPGSIPPRLLMQMRGRIRNLSEPNIYMYIYRRGDNRALTSFTAIKSYLQRRRSVLGGIRYEQDPLWKKDFDHWQTHFDWLVSQYAFHELERSLASSNFLLETLKQLMHHGDSWQFVPPFQCEPLESSSEKEHKEEMLQPISPYKEFLDSPLVSWGELKRKTQNKLNKQDLDMQICKSRLYYTYCNPLHENPGSLILSSQQTAILWEIYKLYQSKPTRRILWQFCMSYWYPTPSLWAEKHNQGDVFQLGQEFFPRQVARYRILNDILSFLGFQNINDFHTVCFTKTCLHTTSQIQSFLKLLQDYDCIGSKEALSTKIPFRNIPGMMQRVSRFLTKFSGQHLSPFCDRCQLFQQGKLPVCPHIKGKRIRYFQGWEQKKEQKTTAKPTKTRKKLYFFTYKLQAGIFGDLRTQIATHFSWPSETPEKEQP
jgi:hypothetical protein